MTQTLSPKTREELRDWPNGAAIPQAEADRLRAIFPSAWQIGQVFRHGNVISFSANDYGPESFKLGLNAARSGGLNFLAPDGDDDTPETVFYSVGESAHGTFKIVLDDGGKNTLATLFKDSAS